MLVHRKLWTPEISVRSFLFFCCPEAGGLIRIENINKEERKVENDCKKSDGWIRTVTNAANS